MRPGVDIALQPADGAQTSQLKRRRKLTAKDQVVNRPGGEPGALDDAFAAQDGGGDGCVLVHCCGPLDGAKGEHRAIRLQTYNNVKELTFQAALCAPSPKLTPPNPSRTFNNLNRDGSSRNAASELESRIDTEGEVVADCPPQEK